jgi:N-acetylglucosamine repressor
MSLKNHSLIKQINRARILNAIRLKSPIARSQLADATSLDKKSITNFVTELLSDGLIEEAGKQEKTSGRPFTMLRFKTQYVVGVYVAPYFASGVLIDLYGNIIESCEEAFPLFASQEKIVAAVAKVCKKMITKRKPIIGAGVCLPGFLDMEKGVVLESVNMPGLKGCEFIKTFSGLFSCPVRFEEASRAGALAEKWFGAGQKYQDFVCIEASVGLGSGIVHNRRLFEGAGHYAGEVGHVVIEPGGRRCRCGNLGCLEAYVSERRILEQLNAMLPEPLERLQDVELDQLPKKELTPLITDIGTRLGQGMAAVVNIICPRYIILHGTIADKFGDALLPHISKALRANCPPGCFAGTEVIISTLKHGDALGAAALPLAEFFEVPEYYYV